MPLPGQKSLLPRIMNAGFSDDRKYRYILTRDWSRGKTPKSINFVMTNPSVADETNDDPTIRRCLGFADSWGYNVIVVTNLFAWRNIHPSWLRMVSEPVGPRNNSYLLTCAKLSDLVICAWGNYGGYRDRDQEVIRFFQDNKLTLYCLGLTNSGRPRYPLRLKKNLTPQPWLPMKGRG